MIILTPIDAFSKVPKASLDISTRYDNIDNGKKESRLQERLRLHLDSDISKRWQIKTLVGTGNTYVSLWSTYHNFKNNQQTLQTLGVRQLYGEFTSSKDSILQLGIIPPSKDYSRTSIIKSGWIEGASYFHSIGKWSAYSSVGSIKDINEPDIFDRERKLNYGKLRGTYIFNESARIKAGIISLDKDFFLQSEVKFFPILDFKESWYVVVESMRNTNKNVLNYNLQTTFFPLSYLSAELKDYLSLQFSYCYIDDQIGLLGTLSEDFYTFGHTGVLEASGKITEKNDFSWFLEYRNNIDPRYFIGLMYKVNFQ
jgi:hypothetical protein